MGLTVERAVLAARIKHHHDQESVDQARAELKAAKLGQQICEAVAAWPPLTDAQRAQLALLLHPGAGDHAAT
jgi:hypothetical protein